MLTASSAITRGALIVGLSLSWLAFSGCGNSKVGTIEVGDKESVNLLDPGTDGQDTDAASNAGPQPKMPGGKGGPIP